MKQRRVNGLWAYERAGASLSSQPERLSSSCIDFTLKAFNQGLLLDCSQLMVGKVGSPPLFAYRSFISE